MISQEDALKLIGEINGINLRTEDGLVIVTIELYDEEIQVISDAGENIDHHITRSGIMSVIDSYYNGSDNATH